MHSTFIPVAQGGLGARSWPAVVTYVSCMFKKCRFGGHVETAVPTSCKGCGCVKPPSFLRFHVRSVTLSRNGNFDQLAAARPRNVQCMAQHPHGPPTDPRYSTKLTLSFVSPWQQSWRSGPMPCTSAVHLLQVRLRLGLLPLLQRVVEQHPSRRPARRSREARTFEELVGRAR